MKKIIIPVIVILLSSCKTQRNLVIESDVAIRSGNYDFVYFKNTEVGEFMYNQWLSGYYGDSTNVILVSSQEFSELKKKAKKI